jgi:Flp pilus assembly protein TadG
MSRPAALARDEKGSIAIFFALAMTGIIAALGAALDYSRLSGSKSTLQSALDAAILNAGKTVLATGGRVDRAKLIAELKANLPEDLKPMADQIRLVQTTDKLSAQLSGSLTNRFGSFIGSPRSSIAAAASVPLGSTRLEVALVLDTTGSMGQLGKMDALKNASNQLIDTLLASRQVGTEIAIGVVPFATQVRVDTSNTSQSWLTLRTGQANPAENTSVSSWDGCIMDRDMPLNRRRKVPDTSRDAEKYPAQNCSFGNVQRILPLTTDLGQVRWRISQLIPDGTTNTTIGMVWGYNILNPSAPLGGGAAPASRKPIRTMVFLTDGLNTADRFGQTTAQMDADMRDLCRDSKAADVRVFTVRVIDGNDNLLRDCASDPADFYTTNNAAELEAVFRAIAAKMTRLRLSS